jgi:hypothetical protein
MKKINSSGSALALVSLLTIILTACGMTKNLVMDSNPKGALVVVQPIEGSPSLLVKGDLVLKETPLCEAPATVEVRFMSDATKATLIAEKRGYTSSSYEVNKDSAEAVFFDLKRIDGVPEATFKKEDLASGRYSLLPAFVEVHIRSGLGRLDKVELSPEASQKVTDELNAELGKTLDGDNKQIYQAAIDASLKTDWRNLSADLNKYVLKLNANRLQYYSLPPYVSANVEGFKPFIERFNDQPGNDKPYLLYVWSRCITETTGRQVGNVMLSVLGPVVAVANPSYVYDPTAFLPNSGTLVVIYVIDAKTSEVVHIEPRVFSDITDGDALRAMASAIGKFPVIDEKKK